MDNNDTQRMSEAEQTALIREHLETSKERARVYREWGYFGLTVLVGTMLIMALWSWRQANLVAGATQARLNGILDKLDTKIDSVQTERLNELLTAGRGTVEGLQPVERELAVFIADNRRNMNRLMLTAEGQINRFGDNLASVKRITDGLGNDTLPAVNALMLKLGRTVEISNAQLPEIIAEMKKDGADVRVILEQPALAGPDSMFDSFNRSAHNLEPVTEDLHNIGVQATAVVTSTAKGTDDVQRYVHNVLYPAPCVGKGCWVKKWIVTPLKASSGLVYLFLKAQSGQL